MPVPRGVDCELGCHGPLIDAPPGAGYRGWGELVQTSRGRAGWGSNPGAGNAPCIDRGQLYLESANRIAVSMPAHTALSTVVRRAAIRPASMGTRLRCERMKIAVTGAAGFIGSHLCEALANDGRRVVGIDNFDDFYAPARKRENLSRLTADERFRLIEGDVRDADALRAAIEGADAVVHLAARAGVRPSFEVPDVYAENNVVATCTLLETITALEVPRLVFISSSSIYGEGAESPFREDADTGVPKSPYAATKVAGEALCRAFAHRIPRIAVLRLFSVYGPRQRPDLAIQAFATRISAGEPIPVLGNTRSFRDYTYVDDIVGGIAASLELDEPWAVLNIGSGSPITLDEMITKLEQAFGRRVERRQLPPHPGDLFGTWADTSAAKRMLGFEPQWTFDRGVEKYVEWFRSSAS